MKCAANILSSYDKKIQNKVSSAARFWRTVDK